ncbi:adenylyltransferase/cytidyltransferase family protein [Candidatus Micrarchaeota archaeon]|nr:adenylyltransferase/cytidyltransferase family protein [Candidatus Micrarchaeota archaeon]MBD3417425.1 adenylyltransferase/cytidyltransferase family protein [Candidatus Micrarchaeota archaeon]
MGVKEVAIRLYLKEVEGGGIATKEYHKLSNLERYLLEKRAGKYYLREMHRKKFSVAMTGGVFDIVHIGHIHTLTEAKEKADVLVVVVAQDKHIKKKKRKPLHGQEHRRVLVQALKPVDLAILGGENMEETFERVGPDLIVYGYDQKAFLKPKGTKVVRLKSKIDPKEVKTRKILRKLGI